MTNTKWPMPEGKCQMVTGNCKTRRLRPMQQADVKCQCQMDEHMANARQANGQQQIVIPVPVYVFPPFHPVPVPVSFCVSVSVCISIVSLLCFRFRASSEVSAFFSVAVLPPCFVSIPSLFLPLSVSAAISQQGNEGSRTTKNTQRHRQIQREKHRERGT